MTTSIERSVVAEHERRTAPSSMRDLERLSSRLLMPAALLALGIRKLLTGSFIPGWQPVPSSMLHPVLAAIDALALIALSVAAVTGPRRDRAYVGLACLMLLWIIAFQGPTLVVTPLVPVLWLGVAEVGAIASAAVVTSIALSPRLPRSDGVRNAGFVFYGTCCLVFGASHFVYVDFTSKMIPGWLPAHVALAYLTGSAHLAAGLAIASGVLRRSAALLLALMMAMFVALIHIPEAIAPTASLAQITFLMNACALCGSALAIACASKAKTVQRAPC